MPLILQSFSTRLENCLDKQHLITIQLDGHDEVCKSLLLFLLLQQTMANCGLLSFRHAEMF